MKINDNDVIYQEIRSEILRTGGDYDVATIIENMQTLGFSVEISVIESRIKTYLSNPQRDAERVLRQQDILQKKRTIINLMVVSWRLKEIRQPSPEEYKSFSYNYPMTWKYILEIQKKYWE